MDKARASPRPLPNDDDDDDKATCSTTSNRRRRRISMFKDSQPQLHSPHDCCAYRTCKGGALISMILFLFLSTLSFFRATTTTTTTTHQLSTAFNDDPAPRATVPELLRSRTKPQLAHNEFHVHKRNVTASDIAHFFYGYNYPDDNRTTNSININNEDQKTSIKMMALSQIYWPSRNNTKLILSHIPRTGMSLVISLLRVLEQVPLPTTTGNETNSSTSLVYLGMGNVANCWDVSAASILADTAYWMNERGSPAEGRHCALFWQNKTH